MWCFVLKSRGQRAINGSIFPVWPGTDTMLQITDDQTFPSSAALALALALALLGEDPPLELG